MNGAATRARHSTDAQDLLAAPPPEAVAELAAGCVRFVEQATGFRLDFQPETLPVLDHYLSQARGLASGRPEALAVVAHAAGAYLGEVIRRRHRSWWRLEGDDPSAWRIELEAVYLIFNPVLFVREALSRISGDAVAPARAAEDLEGADPAPLELEEEDRQAVSIRLAELPPVSEEEYYAPSTRLEVIDIAVDAIRARRMVAGEDADAALEPDDYDRD